MATALHEPDAAGPGPASAAGGPDAASAGARPTVRTALRAASAYVVAALVTFAVALWTYRPWALDDVIAFPGGDSLSFHAWIQSTMETGWYETTQRLAAPFGQNGHTYVVTDDVAFAVVGKILAPLGGSAADGVLWWLVLGFPAAAIATVGLARHLGIGRLAAVVPGVLVPLLPDHFARGTAHYTLAATWAVPLGVWMAVSLLRRPRWSGRRLVAVETAMLLAGAVIALTNAYYAIFTILLVAVAGVAGALNLRSWRVLLRGVARGLSLLVPIVVAMWVDSRYAPRSVGYTSFDISRSPADAETYGGKIIAMLLPSPDHRWEFFREVRQSYDTTFPNPAEFPALGLVAALSFIGLVVWSILAHWRRPGAPADRRLLLLAGTNWLLLLAYSVGGLGSIWAFVLNGGGVRVWSRLHVYIALVSLLALAVALDHLRRRALGAGLVAAVLVVGVVDQTTPRLQPPFEAARAVADDLTGVTDAIAQREGADAAVYQYPQVSFPVHNRDIAPASPYDNFLPYLYSEDLRWSYGGFEGEPTADWPESLSRRPVTEQVALLGSAGFEGVLVDTLALTSDPALRDDLTAALGAPDLTSPSGRWQYHDLNADAAPCTPDATELVSDLALRPPILYPSDGFAFQTDWNWRSSDGPGELTFLTLRDGGWPLVDTRLTVRTTTASVRFTFPDGTTRDVPAGTETELRWAGAVPESGASVTVDRVDGDGAFYVSRMVGEPVVPQADACVSAWSAQATEDD